MIKKINLLVNVNGITLQRYPEILQFFIIDLRQQVQSRAKHMSLHLLNEVGVEYYVEKIDIRPVFLQKEIFVQIYGDIDPLLAQAIQQFTFKWMRQMYPFLTTFDATKQPNCNYLKSLNKNTKSVLNK